MNSLFDEFRTICSHLNQVGITDQMKNGGRLTLTFMCLVILEVGKHLINSEFMSGTR